LGLAFSAISVGPQTTQSQIMGYMDANGRYVETEFRRRFEQGGIVLLDEFDAANPGVGTCINGATANDGCGFPDRYVVRHPDFICICAMNTFGTGADRQYVGRNQLDAATLDRFAFVDWPYDEDLELELAPDAEWCKYVQTVRRAVGKLKLRHVVSPRASFAGARMLQAGIERKLVEQAVIWKGLAETEIAKVKGELDNV
jgi:cobaltochelatase CobS